MINIRMETSKIRPKGRSLSEPTRATLSLGSRIFTVLLSVLYFFFWAIPNCYAYTKLERRTVGGEMVLGEVVYRVSGYSAAFDPADFSPYSRIFLLGAMAVCIVAILAFVLQLSLLKDLVIPNCILLCVQVLTFEFLLGVSSFGGIALFVLSFLNFLQYFIFAKKKDELSYWFFGGTLLLILVMIPSGIAVSNLFR